MIFFITPPSFKLQNRAISTKPLGHKDSATVCNKPELKAGLISTGYLLGKITARRILPSLYLAPLFCSYIDDQIGLKINNDSHPMLHKYQVDQTKTFQILAELIGFHYSLAIYVFQFSSSEEAANSIQSADICKSLIVIFFLFMCFLDK